MSIKGKLFRLILKGREDKEMTEEITIRKTFIDFEEVTPQSIENDDDFFQVEHRNLEVPSERPLISLLFPYRTIQEISQSSGIPESTLGNWCRDGQIEAFQHTTSRRWWIKGSIKDAKKVGHTWTYRQVLT